MASPSEDIAKEIYDIIGRMLMLPGEKEPPFGYLGLIDDYNGVQIEQSSQFLTVSCSKYIHRIMKTHGWDKPSPHESTIDFKAVPKVYQIQDGLEEHAVPGEPWSNQSCVHVSIGTILHRHHQWTQKWGQRVEENGHRHQEHRLHKHGIQGLWTKT